MEDLGAACHLFPNCGVNGALDASESLSLGFCFDYRRRVFLPNFSFFSK